MNKLTLDHYLSCKNELGLSFSESVPSPCEIARQLFTHLVFIECFSVDYWSGDEDEALYQMSEEPASLYHTFHVVSDSLFFYLGELPLFEQDENVCYEASFRSHVLS